MTIEWQEEEGQKYKRAQTSTIKIDETRNGRYRLTFTPAPLRAVTQINVNAFMISAGIGEGEDPF